jgi:type IX secretion system PorP/SprF family membrane protein
MKKNWIVVLMVGIAFTSAVNAQYVPNNSQAFQFISVYNPAFSGVENFDDLKFGYRYQWAGFGKYSPKFINLAFHKRLKQPLDMSYNSMRLSDFSNARAARVPRAKRIIHGMGANLFQSTVGIVKSIGGSFSYSLNYPLTSKIRLAAGVSALLENRKMDISAVDVRDPDPYYDYLLRSSTSQTDLNLRAGLLLYGEQFYLGISYLPMVNVALQASELAMEEPFYRGSLQAGYSFHVADEVILKPSILALVQMNNGIAVDYNVKAYFQNKIWMGLTYRDIESGVGILGFNINDTFTASYSFELSLGDFRKFDDGSHELVLAARLKNLKRFSQYIW